MFKFQRITQTGIVSFVEGRLRGISRSKHNAEITSLVTLPSYFFSSSERSVLKMIGEENIVIKK